MSTPAPAAQSDPAAIERIPSVRQALVFLTEQEEWIMSQQVRLVSIPAPPFHETERALEMERLFREVGLEDVHRDAVGNVLGSWPGEDPERVILVAAHLDTVFSAETPIRIRQEGKRWYGPGIGDNGIGLAALLAMARAVVDHRIAPQASLLFVANVGEEGEGDLRGMKALFADSGFRRRVQAAVILDGATAERLTTKALGSKRFEVTVSGPGGHSWADFGLPNPIQALARAVHRLTALELPNPPRTTLNVGTVSGGTSVNAVPAEASMKVDIRSEMDEEITRLEDVLRQAVQEAVTEENAWARRKTTPLTYEIETIGQRPAGELDAGAQIVRVFRAVDEFLGIRTVTQRSSTDANVPIAMGIEAVNAGGGGRTAASHSLDEWFEPEGRDLALKRVLLAVLLLAGIENPG